MKGTLNLRRYWAALAIATTLGIGILIGTVVSHEVRAARDLPPVPAAKPLADPSPVALSNSFASIAAKVSPAVVNINTKSTIRFSGNDRNSPGGGVFRHFFQFGPEGVPRDMQQESLGSGVILDKNGYVLTNYHVIVQDDGEPVDSIQVYLRGQDRFQHGYTARIAGYDRWTDLAVLKITAGRPLPIAQLGDSDSMRVGDWVLAIGSPFDLQDTVTAGIISAKGREIGHTMEDEFKEFLQTDAAINPGNSGGPLVNLAGQVVGINTAIATTRDAYDGVGFAIPSKIARRIYNDLVTTGAVRRGAIGVNFVNEQNDSLLRSFGASHGVVVQSVSPGSPAERAGLKMGDVVTAINSKPIHGGEELLAIVSNTAPDTTVRVDFVRNRKPMSCNVIVGNWNKIAAGLASGPAAPSHPPSEAPASSGVLGLEVKPLPADVSEDVAKQLKLGRAEGVMVESVAPGSFADDLMIRRGNIILSINREVIHSVDDYNRIQKQLKPREDVLLLIARRIGPTYVTQFQADRLP